jgi:molybdopterin converting factor small subunit
MKVNVKCFATLSKEGKCDYHGSTAYELADKSTVRDLVKKLELNEDEIKIIFINHREEALETVLKEGDQVALSPKAGGM